MGNRWDLLPYETNALVDFCMYYMQPKLRLRLARQFPEIYRKLTGMSEAQIREMTE